MNARARVPDFQLPATGNPRFDLSAFGVSRDVVDSIRAAGP